VDWKSPGAQLHSYRDVTSIRRSEAVCDPFAVLEGFYPSVALEEMRAHYELSRVNAEIGGVTDELWEDPYAEGGTRTGQQCPSTHGVFRCVRLVDHDGDHRHTSSADGRSVWWGDDAEQPSDA